MRRAGARDERGFTLVEMLVVLTVIGLMGGVVLLTVPDRRPSLRAEAEGFAARLKRAQDEAVLSNRPVAVRVTESGWSFVARSDGRWAPLDGKVFAPGTWSEGSVAQIDTANGEMGIAFGSTGEAEPAEVTLSRDDRRVSVRVDDAGNVRIDAPSNG